jgi:hypothetical protein
MSLSLLGKPFSIITQNDVSDMRLDAKTWMIDTADNIFTFPQIPGQFFLPRDSAHGFTKNVPCFLSVDGDVIIPLGIKKHSHSIDTDIEGGLLSQNFIDNMGNLDIYSGSNFNVNDFETFVSGTGAAVSAVLSGSQYIVEIDTGTAVNGMANIRRAGLALDYSKNSAFQARTELIGTIANYLLRLGVNAERIDEANNPAEESYGIEACSANANWQTFSSDATARSTTPTSYAVTAALNVWRGVHVPADGEIVFTKDVDDANAVTKSSDIPITGAGALKNLWCEGIKSTLVSQAKQLRHTGAVVYGNIGFAQWKWYNT